MHLGELSTGPHADRVASSPRAPALLSGKVVLITGASRGIGAAASEVFAREGAAVMLVARTEADLGATTARITSAGGTACYAVADVRDSAALAAAVEQTESVYGPLDGAFNNAGIAVPPTELVDLDDDDFDELVLVNFRAVWSAMKQEIRAMRRAGIAGAIVNNSSIGSLYGNAGRAAYSAAKRAVNSLTATAAVECGPSGIRVNAIAPGTTMTPLVKSWCECDPGLMGQLNARTPLGRAAEPAEVAEAAAWLLSDRASYVTGVVLPVDGGLHA
jgi:NAD(P)-dependent dehydrogenase (short-subunit alcohol dehydrogenase family)